VKEIAHASLGAMLSVNLTLERLDVTTYNQILDIGLEVVLTPLTGHDGNPPLNKSL